MNATEDTSFTSSTSPELWLESHFTVPRFGLLVASRKEVDAFRIDRWRGRPIGFIDPLNARRQAAADWVIRLHELQRELSVAPALKAAHSGNLCHLRRRFRSCPSRGVDQDEPAAAVEELGKLFQSRGVPLQIAVGHNQIGCVPLVRIRPMVDPSDAYLWRSSGQRRVANVRPIEICCELVGCVPSTEQ